MATVRGLRGLARRLKEIKQEFLTESETVIKKAGARALQVAVFATRVDTGRARGGWVITIGESLRESGGQTLEDPDGGATIARGEQEIARFRIQDGTLSLSNNVEYILFLDQGSPTNSADNMVAQAVQATIAFIQQTKFLKK